MRTIKTKNCIVTFSEEPSVKDAVFEAVVKFFVDHESFNGESIMQNDNPQMDSPVLLADIADDVLKFNVESI